jgi:conjugal transfer pilus assembly protein TraK
LKYITTGIFVLIMLQSPTFASAKNIRSQLPGIPIEVINLLEEKINGKTEELEQEDIQEPMAQVTSKKDKLASEVTLIPGVNTIVPISQGHINRLVFPFLTPKIFTASSMDFQIEGRAVFIAPHDGSIGTFFVASESDESMAVSLTLHPQAIPPRDITFTIEGYQKKHSSDEVPSYYSRHAADWEKAGSHIDIIRKTLASIALGKIPPGYGLRYYKAGDPVLACYSPGLEITPVQALEGYNQIIIVSLLQNNTDQEIQFKESSCHDGNRVLAVASWPSVRIEPGTASELYVVVKREDPEETISPRPRLIGFEVY